MIKVLIVDDHEMVRLGLSTYIGVQPDLEVVDQAENGQEGVEKDWIENAVIHYIMKIVMDDELIDLIADAILNILAQENSKLPQLNARLKEIETGIQNMLILAVQSGCFAGFAL